MSQILVPEISFVPNHLRTLIGNLEIEYLELCGTPPRPTQDHISGTNIQLLTNVWTLHIHTKDDMDTASMHLIIDTPPIRDTTPCRMNVTVTDVRNSSPDAQDILKRVRINNVNLTIDGLMNLIVGNDLDRYNYTSSHVHEERRFWFKRFIEALADVRDIDGGEKRDALNAVTYVWKGEGTGIGDRVDLAYMANVMRGHIDYRVRIPFRE
ncbi:hypothetical protein AnigIFM50267_005228 [Aspergillus niger]|nr:hypothetical protein AnigIFM50267_005228 [Aspergillus niger]